MILAFQDHLVDLQQSLVISFRREKGVVLIYEKWERLMPYLDVNSQHLFFAYFFFKI